jgi:undecaprenyl pyrophosphate synthase
MPDELLAQLRLAGEVPAHIAIIMDGNGRWARSGVCRGRSGTVPG